jgi:predicted NBD/HSP70 family sugar kinase
MVMSSALLNTRTRNENAVLLQLLRHEYISRVHLAELTALSPTTITKIINSLIQTGLVEEDQDASLPTINEGVGRPRTALRLIPDARYAVGVYLRNGEAQIGIANLRAQVLHSITLPFANTLSPEAVLTLIAKRMMRELDARQIDLERVIGAGFGLNGSVDPVTGLNSFAPGLNWRNVPTYDILRPQLPFPVCADNNVRVMALGESLFGGYQHYKNMALVYVHYGMGSGLVIDGQILRGAYTAAGQISEMTLIMAVDERCQHSRMADMGSLLTEPALIDDGCRAAAAAGQSELAAYLQSTAADRLERLFDEARRGNFAIQAFLNERAQYMGIALANLVNLINPEMVLLAGNVYTKGIDVMLPPTQAAMQQHTFGNIGELVQLAVVPANRPIGLIGAAAFALDSYFYRSGEVVSRIPG